MYQIALNLYHDSQSVSPSPNLIFEMTVFPIPNFLMTQCNLYKNLFQLILVRCWVKKANLILRNSFEIRFEIKWGKFLHIESLLCHKIQYWIDIAMSFLLIFFLIL